MEQQTSQIKRPGYLTFTCIMMVLGAIHSITAPFIYKIPGFTLTPQALILGVGTLIAAVGLWLMKKWGAYLLGLVWGGGYLMSIYNYFTGLIEHTTYNNIVVFASPFIGLFMFMVLTNPILQPERFAEMERKAAEAKAAAKDKSTPPKEK
jgi:hypothetical protein